MLQESSFHTGIESDWAADPKPAWQTIDHALRTIARRRSALDAEEARWLREAERCQIWRELGMVSALDYMERVLGYSPRTARDRLKVARSLERMPLLTELLAQGQLAYSAVRELARVVTPSTEQAWCDAAVGKNMRQIEDMVDGHGPGDHPEDPPDPAVRTRVVPLELSAEAFALWRQTHQLLDEERGARLSDDEWATALCNAVLDRGDASEPTGRAKFQIALTVCKRCQQGWQEGAGIQVAVDACTVERARCDAQEIGSLDGAEPERAHQDVPPSVMRFVWRRDGGHCRVPGCRSARGIEVHHLVHREHGGNHEASNLILLCSACHSAHHRGKLKISGTAGQLEVERCAESRAHVGTNSAVLTARATGADTKVERCAAHVGTNSEVFTENVTVTSAKVERCAAHVGTNSEVLTANIAKVERCAAHMGTNNEVLTENVTGTSAKVERCAAHVGTNSETLHAHVTGRSAKVERCAAHVGTKGRALATNVTCTQAKEALVKMGWKPKIATAAVQAAASTLGEELELKPLIIEALRRCPRATS